MPSVRAFLIWAVLGAALLAPIALAATSPFLAWREPVYILAGFAGVTGLALLLLQPLLAGAYLPGLSPRLARKVHFWVGLGLVLCVVVHVGGLWVTSPPDVVDALLFRSPTPFSVWGVIAMWAIFAAALIAANRARLRLSPLTWRLLHTSLALVIVLGTVIHAMLIEGAMEIVSKTVFCAIVLAALVIALAKLRAWTLLRRGRS
ncbi:MAG: ferric reductase-like transmembrane domain-containing protein [Pseudomonadota bacterium]